MKNLVKKYNLPEKNFINQDVYRIFAIQNNIQKVINAKKQYDCVILTRLDLCLNSKLIIPEDLNKVTFPIGEGYYPNMKRKIGCAKVFGSNYSLNDQLLISNSEIMNNLANIYDIIPKYYNLNSEYLNNETLIGQYCLLNNIAFSQQDIINYLIFR